MYSVFSVNNILTKGPRKIVLTLSLDYKIVRPTKRPPRNPAARPHSRSNISSRNMPIRHWAQGIYDWLSTFPKVKIWTNGLLSTVSGSPVVVSCGKNVKDATANLQTALLLSAVDFFNQINMLYGTITEFCTPQDCPVMSAGPKYEYHWKDDGQFKKPARVSAPIYVDHLMSWVQSQLDNEAIFPSKIGKKAKKKKKKMLPSTREANLQQQTP